jgi:hypothetical protein
METPAETALETKMAITIPAINFPIVIETAAIAFTQLCISALNPFYFFASFKFCSKLKSGLFYFV